MLGESCWLRFLNGICPWLLLQVKVHGLVVASAADASRQIDMCTVSLAHPSVQHALSRTVGGGNKDAAIVEYTISVTNTGLVDADDVVLGFLTPPRAGIGGVPLQSLFGFERVHLRSGKAECTHGPSRRHRFNQRCSVAAFVSAAQARLWPSRSARRPRSSRRFPWQLKTARRPRFRAVGAHCRSR